MKRHIKVVKNSHSYNDIAIEVFGHQQNLMFLSGGSRGVRICSKVDKFTIFLCVRKKN